MIILNYVVKKIVDIVLGSTIDILWTLVIFASLLTFTLVSNTELLAPARES